MENESNNYRDNLLVDLNVLSTANRTYFGS